MQAIVIYTRSTCGYCDAAKDLLRQKQAAFTEIPVDGDAQAWSAMSERSGGRRTVPQIFIGTTHVGGCDDLYALEQAGRLEPLLNGAAR